MKKIVSIFLLFTFMLSLVACGSQTASNNGGTKEEENSHTPIAVKSSPDKYTWYIKDYVGKNCASLGYTSIGGDRMDHYGAAIVELIFVTEDGSYVDFETEDTLKEYVVTGQNISPNSEMKLTFEKDDGGEEYENLVETQSYEEIVLSVAKIGGKNKMSLTEIKPSPDKYTWYIADYVGRNLATCGYTSMGGDRRVKYGEANLKLVIISEDGSFIEPEDAEALKSYVVTSQNVTPNTELKLVFDKDSNFVDSQSIEEIELYVKKIN